MIPKVLRIPFLTVAGILLVVGRLPGSTVANRTALAGSVRVPDASGRLSPSTFVARTQLTTAELAAPMGFSVTLRMRNFAELQSRVAAGGTVSEQEMEFRYRPLKSDFDRLARWLSGQGFTTRFVDRTHTTAFVQGSIAAIQQSFGTTFARVTAADGEYTSIVSAPLVPSDLAAVVLAVHGLQPEFRLRRKHTAYPVSSQVSVLGSTDSIFVMPSDVRGGYQVPTSANGEGQIVAIVGEYAVLASDVADFRSDAGLPAMTGNLTATQVNGQSGQATPGTADEETLDVEWCGAMATAVTIRQYLASDVSDCLAQILTDLPSFPAMRVVSMSYGTTESEEGGVDAVAFYTQEFASLAAGGVSVFVASGDAGSNPTGVGESGDFSATAAVQTEYPASDPDVTGVGGTDFDISGSSDFGGETVWNDFAATSSASGGGVSSYFAKPSWQTGGSVLAGQTMRCVPDVAAIAEGNLTSVIVPGYQAFTGGDGVLVVENGALTGDTGTSLATPVWAGVAALINQSRASHGEGSVGFLNPQIYPLQGTSAFNDVTSGTNGAYSAGVGYDLCTGLGTPNVTQLLAALGGQTVPADRLINLSSRAQVGTGGNIMIAGFVIDSASGGTKSVLVRGIGPALTNYGVTGALAVPEITVFDSSGAAIATDAGWSNAPTVGPSTVGGTERAATAADMSSVGAFALTAGSADSAMVLTLPAGSYTVQVMGANESTGIALAEVYEVQTNVSPILGNLSTRCFVGTGAQLAIAGLVVQGTCQVLLRGVGPALVAYGVTGALAQPSLSILDSSGNLIASNTGWGNAPVAGTSSVSASYRAATAADMKSVGAFALTAGSADSAMVVTLPAGSYTVQLSGVSSATGTALAEVYQMSEQ